MEDTSASRALAELNTAISEFRDNYGKFAASNQKFLTVHNDVQSALDKAQSETDIKRSAEIFGDSIFQMMRVTERKQQISDSKWTGKLINFLKKVYPVAQVSLTVIGSVGQVISFVETFLI
jgi:hypothetical protein